MKNLSLNIIIVMDECFLLEIWQHKNKNKAFKAILVKFSESSFETFRLRIKCEIEEMEYLFAQRKAWLQKLCLKMILGKIYGYILYIGTATEVYFHDIDKKKRGIFKKWNHQVAQKHTLHLRSMHLWCITTNTNIEKM